MRIETADIWIPAGNGLPAAASDIFDFAVEFCISPERARDTIMDHAPVWMLLDPEAAWIELSPPASGAKRSSAVGAHQFSDIPAAGEIRGIRNSHVCQIDGCAGFHRISRRSIVLFAGEAEAPPAGHGLARNYS